MRSGLFLGDGVGALLGGFASAVACAVAASACGPADSARTGLQIYAASSLTEAFTEIESAFELVHPDTDVRLTFAGSQTLRIQIQEGAPADVFASADPGHVQALEAAGLVNGGQVFARNELVVIVPPDNPAGIESFADLPRAQRIVLGTENVPIGRYARLALARAGAEGGGPGGYPPSFADDVLARVVSEEANVRLVRAKVELGEADAAIVYRTDALASAGVRMVEIPATANVGANYLIALVTDAGNRDAGTDWIAFVLSDEGRGILARHGFGVG